MPLLTEPRASCADFLPRERRFNKTGARIETGALHLQFSLEAAAGKSPRWIIATDGAENDH
jgi:hypothetical protein